MSMSKPQPRGDAPPPAVQHLLVRYAKRGKMRFASHLDVARAFERGVRRAGLPIAYSAGFTPHPKISYAGGAPTGVASEWQVALPGLRPDDVVPVVQKFLALTEAPVERLTSKGMRRMDARAAVVSLSCHPGGRPPAAGTMLRMVV